MDEPLFMDAVITPNRSLSSRGFIILISVMTVINVLTAAVFVALGAAPIPFFLGLDLTAVIFAFMVSRGSAARRREHIQVTAAEVRVILQERDAEPRAIWISPTAFTRVELAGDAGSADDLTLSLSDRRMPVARTLSRPERLEFAKALHDAIGRARTGGAWA